MHDYDGHLKGGVEIVPGRTGAFEVSLGERRIFSKLESDRFPEDNEVEEQLGQVLHAD